jgi:hypothetical protein
MPEAAGVPSHPPAPSTPAAPIHSDNTAGRVALSQRVLDAADGLHELVDTAQAAQVARAKAAGAPRWTDVFTTQFTEFSNRPR